MVLTFILQGTSPSQEVEGYLGTYIRVVDIVLAFFILWGAYKGWQKGFFVELISTVVFIFSTMLIFFSLTWLFQSLDEGFFQMPKFGKFMAYFIFYSLIAGLLNKLSRLLQYKVDYSIFDSFDNFMAMILGAIKYAMFLAILIGLLDAAGLRLSNEVARDTKLYPMLLNFQAWLVEVGRVLAPFVGEVNEYIRRILR